MLPEIGSRVRWGKSTYEVVRHGCATYMDDCPYGEHAITVLWLDRKYQPRVTATLCIPADKTEEVK